MNNISKMLFRKYPFLSQSFAMRRDKNMFYKVTHHKEKLKYEKMNMQTIAKHLSLHIHHPKVSDKTK